MKLRELREEKGLTQREVAELIGVSPVVYNRYEKGIREPSNDMLVTIAVFFGVTVDELLGRTDAQKPSEHEDDAWEIRERLRRDPSYRMLFSAADRATPEQLKAAAAMLRSFQGDDDET